ncbi:Uncharacterised protein [Mycobacterium tuberculosis]|nr:Uncharacterised protein [Mycobacterium tuberculosis]
MSFRWNVYGTVTKSLPLTGMMNGSSRLGSSM